MCCRAMCSIMIGIIDFSTNPQLILLDTLIAFPFVLTAVHTSFPEDS
jgi:hypothetical protein